jgi:phage/plasmid-associated DNA primase
MSKSKSSKSSSSSSSKGKQTPLSFVPSISDESVEGFLRNRRAVSSQSQNWTLASRIVPLGKYLLANDDDETEFFRQYSQAMEKVGTDFFCGLEENPQSECPLIVKIHAPYSTDEQVSEAIGEIGNVLNECLQQDAIGRRQCFVLTYDWDGKVVFETNKGLPPESAGLQTVKLEHHPGQDGDGSRFMSSQQQRLLHSFVLHFPNIFLSDKDIELIIYPYIHEKLHTIFPNADDTLIDVELLTKPYLLYGSRDYDTPPLKVVRVLDDEAQDFPVDTMLRKGLDGYELWRAERFSVTDHADCKVEWMPIILHPKTEVEALSFLPEVLSIHRRYRKCFEIQDNNTTTEMKKRSFKWVTEQAMRRWYRIHQKDQTSGLGDRSTLPRDRTYRKVLSMNQEHVRRSSNWTSKSEAEIERIDKAICEEPPNKPSMVQMLSFKKRVMTSSKWRQIVRILFDLYGGHETGLQRLVELTCHHPADPKNRSQKKRSRSTQSYSKNDSDNDSDHAEQQQTEPDTEPDTTLDGEVIYEAGVADLMSNDQQSQLDAHRAQLQRAVRSRTANLKPEQELSPEKRCLWEWHRHVPEERFTLQSLEVLYAEDNTPAFQRMEKIKLRNTMNSMLANGGNQSAIARFIARTFQGRWVCVSTRGTGDWFHFYSHRWHAEPGGSEFINEAKILIEDQCEHLIDQWDAQLDDIKKTKRKARTMDRNQDFDDVNGGSPDYDEEQIKMHIKAVERLQNNWSKTGFQNSVFQQCRDLMFERKFEDRLDNNANLLGFENGVLDLSRGKHGCGVFRKGHQKDYITKSCGYDFPTHITSRHHREVMVILQHLTMVFPNARVREYFLEFCGSLLKGGNPDKIVVIFNGGGHNAKSVTNNMLEKALGDYYQTLPCSVLTGKRAESNAATPDLNKLSGARYLVLNEPEREEVINAGKFKEYSGNDPFMARGLFKEPRIINPMFKMCITCNDEPRFSAEDDPAVWSRVRKIHFASRFDNDAETKGKSFKQQLQDKTFLRDPDFNDKLVPMRRGLMWLMYYYYRKRCLLGADREPDEVIEATVKYRIRNDAVDRFLREHVTTTRRREQKDKAGNPIAGADGNDGSYVHADSDVYKEMITHRRLKMDTTAEDMFNQYKKWYMSQGFQATGKSRFPSMDIVMASFIKFYGMPSKNPAGARYWPGVFLRIPDVNLNGSGQANESEDGATLDVKVV